MTFAIRYALAAGLLAAITGCATWSEPEGSPRKETVFAVTADHQLIRFNAGQPRKILERKPVTGLAAGERLLGIDYRVAKGVLFALASSGRLYTLDTDKAMLKPVASAPSAVLPAGAQFGFDFNPAADRIRVVSDSGQNLRLHPDTGAAVDGNAAADGVQADTTLAYRAGDVNAGQAAQLLAAGYTYNKTDEKLTTNYAIDGRLGLLVMQGSREGSVPAVSPNTGQLGTVGTLGLGPVTEAAFDIADVSNAALAAVRTAAMPRTRLHLVDLQTGRATLLGTVGDGGPLVGIAIEP